MVVMSSLLHITTICRKTMQKRACFSALTTCQALPRVRLGTGDFLGAEADM